MMQKNANGFRFFLTAVGEIFSFFFALGRKTKKTKVFYFISFLPVLIAIIVRIGQSFSGGNMLEGITIFSNMIMVFYLQFFILILALFYGTSVCSEELEAKTLTYLTTRPVSKSAVICGKYLAYTLLIILMTDVGVILSFIILNLESLQEFSLYGILLRDLAVLSLGLICYAAFFSFIGTFMRKSILFGLVFSFGWENVIQYFPGSTQRFAIVHYLKSLLPASSRSDFSVLLFRLEPTSKGMAIFMLFLITAAFIALACIVFSNKEYIFED